MSVRIYDDADLSKLKEVLDSGRLCSIGGEFTPMLEQAFADAMGTKHGVAMNSAMSILHSSVAAADAGVGDEVVCDPIVQFAGIATMYNNAVPVFADVRRDTYNIDPQSIRERITERTKAIIVTHLWGLPCDMDPIMEIAREYNLVVIEDCAHALFAEYKGHYAGTLGHIGSFSFQQSKHLSTGDGGIGITDDEELKDKMVDMAGPTFYSVAHRLAWNYRMTELVAAIALVQLERARKYVDEIVANANLYTEAIMDTEWLVPQRVPEGYKHSYHIWVCTFEGERYGIHYDDFKKAVSDVGCSAGFGYTQQPAYLYPAFYEPIAYGRGCPIKCPLYEGKLNYSRGACPVAEEIIPKMVLIYTAGPKESHERNAELLRRAAELFS